MNKYIFLDTETTSLDARNGNITELGFIYQYDHKIRMRKLLKGTEQQIYNSFITILDSFVDRFNPNDKLTLIAHNASFDSDFLREMFRRNGNQFYGAYFYNPPICTMQMAGVYFLKRRRPENFKLATLLKYFSIPFEEDKLHSALYDATVMRELFKNLKSNKMKTKSLKKTVKPTKTKAAKPVAKANNYVTVENYIQMNPVTNTYRARVTVNGSLMQSPFVTSITKARTYRKEFMKMRG